MATQLFVTKLNTHAILHLSVTRSYLHLHEARRPGGCGIGAWKSLLDQRHLLQKEKRNTHVFRQKLLIFSVFIFFLLLLTSYVFLKRANSTNIDKRLIRHFQTNFKAKLKYIRTSGLRNSSGQINERHDDASGFLELRRREMEAAIARKTLEIQKWGKYI